MGKISKCGIASGTSGSKNISLENAVGPSMNSATNKIKENQLKHQNEMAKILDEAGVKKYNKKDLLFVTNDVRKNLIFLEKGNHLKGLIHIGKHRNQIIKCHKLPLQTDIVKYIENFIANGQILYQKPSKNHDGFDRVYKNNDKHFLYASVGSNGYLVTCFPIQKKFKKEKN